MILLFLMIVMCLCGRFLLFYGSIGVFGCYGLVIMVMCGL